MNKTLAIIAVLLIAGVTIYEFSTRWNSTKAKADTPYGVNGAGQPYWVDHERDAYYEKLNDKLMDKPVKQCKKCQAWSSADKCPKCKKERMFFV